MNERIQELAEQANTIGDWGEDITEGRYFVYPNIKNLEKFAELIIRECAMLAYDGNLKRAIAHGGSHSDILKHFGVE